MQRWKRLVHGLSNKGKIGKPLTVSAGCIESRTGFLGFATYFR
jgi:hypothetical protein